MSSNNFTFDNIYCININNNNIVTPLKYAEITKSNIYTNILLIDCDVKDHNIFVESVNSSTYPIVYSTTSTKTDLLSLLRTHFTTILRIGIVFDLGSNNFKKFLDSELLFDPNQLLPCSENEQYIIDLIKEFNIVNIDFLACNTLKYPQFINYYNRLTEKTNVVIGASNDLTGNIKYGGDWIMESTKQNIEFIYFTKSIEYYLYLLGPINISSFTSNLNFPVGLIIDNTGTYMYVTNSNGNLTQINMSDGSIKNASWVSSNAGLYTPTELAIDSTGTFMYVTNFSNNIISKINMFDGSINNISWINTGIDHPTGIVIDSGNNFIYVSNYYSNTISKINLLNGSMVNLAWVDANVGLSRPYGLIIDSTGTYMYVANLYNNTISQINMSNGSMNNATWVSISAGLSNPVGLVIDNTGTYMYVTNLGTDTITQINMSDGSVNDVA